MGHAPQHIQLIGSAQEAETLRVADPDRVAVITQTTLSLDDTSTVVDVLRRRFPGIEAPTRDDICYATQNRQVAVKALSRRVPVILVIGSKNSSNSNRLAEVAQAAGARPTYRRRLADRPDLAPGRRVPGHHAGASAPEHLVDEVVRYFRARGATDIEEVEASRKRSACAPAGIGAGPRCAEPDAAHLTRTCAAGSPHDARQESTGRHAPPPTRRDEADQSDSGNRGCPPAVTKASGSNFAYAFWSPQTQARSPLRHLRFCRISDDVVDEASSAGANGRHAGERLKAWRAELDACFRGEPATPSRAAWPRCWHGSPSRGSTSRSC